MDFAEFLESVGPNSPVEILGEVTSWGTDSGKVLYPDVTLHCDECGGPRCYRTDTDRPTIRWRYSTRAFVRYTCSNCQSSFKTFAIQIVMGASPSEPMTLMKFGENPEFGDPIPPRVSTLVGEDRELFFKGYRCEKQGLGIGAYGYYRRVVDSQWQRLLSEIIAVAKREGAPGDTIRRLENAKAERLFGKGFDAVKDLVPTSLRVHGDNPLTLLYDALSNQLHNASDEECLTHARAARLVLFELAERIGAALKETTELKSALAALNKARQPPDVRSGK